MISPAYGLALEANANDVPTLAQCYSPWAGICSNHIVTPSGEFSGADGSSRSISSAADRQLLIALREQADLIVVDAETARREQYRLPSSGTALAIFSQSGIFSGIPALEGPYDRCFLFSPTTPGDFPNHRHVQIRTPENPLQELSRWAKDEDLPAVLLEAGPTLSKTAFDSRLVSYSALTITERNIDLDSIAKAHPFDDLANLISVAHSQDATFTYWTH
jgi:hypothetical protein